MANLPQLVKQSHHVQARHGGEVTTISEEEFQNLKDMSLEKPSKVLYGPAHQSLDVCGQFTATLVHQQLSSSQI